MQQRHLLERAELMSAAFRIADIHIITGSAVIVYYLRKGEPMPSGYYPLFVLILIFLTTNIYTLFSVYRVWRGQWLYRELTHVTLAWLTVIFVTSMVLFLTKTGANFSRLWVGWTFVLSYAGMISFRILGRRYLHYARQRGLNQKRVIIVGAGKLGKRACDAMLRETWAGLVPIGFFDDYGPIVGQSHKNVRVLGDIDDVEPYIEGQRRLGSAIDQVWITLPLHAEGRIEYLQHALQDTATNVYFIPNVFGFKLANYSVDEVVGLPIMNMSATPMQGGKALVKRIEDLFIASSLLIILSPFLAAIAALIKFESPGPVIFKQRRYGQDGTEILVWKFRSMLVTEDGDNIKQAEKNDKRVTRIGAWLRKLSLDELPQLINVIMGNMSLVGPRPHAVAHNEFYRNKVHGYMGRHKIRPGITGWAQINGCRGETAQFDDMEKRISYDLEYIRNWSIPLDIRILFRTVKTVINTNNAY